MSPFEILHRIKDEINKKTELVCLKDFVPDISLSLKKVNWYADLMERIEDKGTRVKAEELLAHKFSFFSLEKEPFGNEINWHKDYKSGKQSPLVYSKSIDYRDYERIGDIKHIWEVNRHHHLIVLAKEYYLSGEQRYKNEVIQQIKSWIKANPYMKGVNWESSLELGIRLISWSWVWNFIGDLDEEFKKVWLECIYKHCYVISKNLSSYSSANNHLIGEAAGLFIACIVWPFEKKSAVWVKKSFDVLVAEMEKQNYADGVNKEQAISYQQFVLDFFILAGLLGEKNNIKFPENYWQRIEKMIEFVASIIDKNGSVPNIGDADDGYAVILSEKEWFNICQSLIATGAVLFKRGDFKSKSNGFDEKSFWLLGVDGFEKFNALEEKRFETIKKFDEGGYYVIGSNDGKDDEIKAVFDCGPLGYLSLAAHGHADALSFTLSIGGREVIVDPGTYAYHTQKEWREYFRGTSAHNTIRINKKNQSVSGGNFMWLKKARASLLDWKSDNQNDFVKGEHNGYMRFKDPVKHEREILFNKVSRSFKIIDRIKACNSHYIEQFFHFSEECSVRKIDEGKWEIRNNDVVVYIRLDKKLKVDIVKGSADTVLGWRSLKFDVKFPIFTMVGSLEGKGSCELETFIETENSGENHAN